MLGTGLQQLETNIGNILGATSIWSTNMNIHLLRIKSVISITGLSRSSIYAMQANGTFPASISIGPRAIAWSSTDIDEWIKSRVTLSKASIQKNNTMEGL